MIRRRSKQRNRTRHVAVPPTRRFDDEAADDFDVADELVGCGPALPTEAKGK